MELSTSITPVSIMVEGAKKFDRQMSVVHRADPRELAACQDMKGAIGKAIRAGGAQMGLVDIAKQAANGNYAPLARVLAIRTAEPWIFSGKSTFEALPDTFKARVFKAQLGKNDGMRTVKKTGLLADGSKLASEKELHAMVCNIVAYATEYAASLAAKRQAEREERTAITAE